MKQIYIVIEGGCLRYVSTDSEYVIKDIGVTLIDLDDQREEEDPERDALMDDITAAEKATRIW